jgi:C_GCAxxG_C_C family probable redox protein
MLPLAEDRPNGGDMTDSDAAAAKQEALAAFLASGAAHRNCAQAVMLFALRYLGGDPEDLLFARYLGGGVARSGLTCGALTGAALALGVRDRLDPATYEEVAPEGHAQLQLLLDDFKAAFGGTSCLELSGCDLSTPAGQEKFAADKVRQGRCVDYVGWVSDRLATLL